MNSYAAVPQVLINLPQWIVWKLERRDGKATKVPYDATHKGTYAKSNDPSTWATFDQALETASDILNDYDGCGFMLQGTDLVGIDFDGVLRDGAAEPFVLDILEKLGNPYSEITPSGLGLRAFVQCSSLPPGQRKFSGNKYGAEIYSGAEGGRYLTVTGVQFSGDGVPKIDDISLPYLLVSQIRNDKFKKLWMGDISGYGDDQSRADLALVDLLVPLLNRDPQKIEWVFGQSKLGQRDKWKDRDDYRLRTIMKALNGEVGAKESSAKPDAATLPPAQAVLRTANTITPKKIKWLWENRVPLGKITLFAGNPDNGKSLAAVSLTAICTTGRDFPDCANTLPASEVLMMIGEDDLDDTAVPRLMAARADMSKIHFLDAVIRPANPDTDVRLDWDLPAIEAKLETHPNVRLVVIDPISNYLGGVSMVAEQETRSILIPLKKIAARHNIAVVVVMHLNKKSELEAISRVGGAMAFTGVARSSWMFIRDAATEDGKTSDTFAMARIKNNLVSAKSGGLAYHIETIQIPIPNEPEPAWTPFVVWDSAIEKSADDVLEAKRTRQSGPGRPAGIAPELQKAMHWLERALQDGPKAQKWLKEHAQEESNVSWATLRRAKEELGVLSHKIALEWLWELPPLTATQQTVTPADEDEGDDHAPINREFDLT
jgi:putative DNA primase/helicase